MHADFILPEDPLHLAKHFSARLPCLCKTLNESNEIVLLDEAHEGDKPGIRLFQRAYTRLSRLAPLYLISQALSELGFLGFQCPNSESFGCEPVFEALRTCHKSFVR